MSIFILYAWVFYLRVHELYACNTHRGQKRASGCLELELRMVVSHPVGARNQTARVASALLLTTEPTLQSHLPFLSDDLYECQTGLKLCIPN